MPPIRVLVIDDSVVIRKLLGDCLASDPDIEVVATASRGHIGLARLSQVQPDLITLDVEMPEMSGLDTLREIRRTHPRLPVIMFSSATERGAATTMDALSLGASDYVTKPSSTGSAADALERVRSELIPKIKALCGRVTPRRLDLAPAAPIAHRRVLPTRPSSVVEAVAIGVSTGGPNALAKLIPALPPDLGVPVLIVQHMPPTFTRILAERLHKVGPFPVREGESGARVKAGEVWIAPGARHMTVQRGEKGAVAIELNEDPPENSCRPAVDVLFRSVAEVWRGRALAVVLTGMGQDGWRGAETIRGAGGQVLAQDEETSVVWGMPGYVARAGLADAVLPLDEVAGEIVRRVRGTAALGAFEGRTREVG
jgi:two-component system, chemotaxis family, protein-glutamate methylesterase/glutaminase